MADPEIIGVIEVPLYSFTFQPNGRDEDQHAIDWLTSVFQKVRCRPELWDNHLKGYINAEGFHQLLQELRCSEDELRQTINTREYPRVQTLRGCIVCLDGRQRIATARKKYGENYSWPVKLYAKPDITRFLYETKDSDGEIYWNIRGNGPEGAEKFYTQLSPGKQSILKRLLKPCPDAFASKREFLHEDIVRSLDSVFSFPGFRKQFLLGNMLKVLSLRCPKEVSHYIQVHVVGTWHSIVGDNHQAVDCETVAALQRRVPSNQSDKAYIDKLIDGGRIFRQIRDPAARAGMKLAISKLNVVLPSMETFHENISFFSLGVGIIRDVILDDALQPRDFGHGTCESDSVFDLLRRSWKTQSQMRVETAQSESNGTEFDQLNFSHAKLASLLLFLSALRKFPYMTKDTPTQDKRKSRDVFLANASGSVAFVKRLCVVAHELGFDTDKIRQAVQLQHSPGNALHHNKAILTLHKPDAEYTIVAESNGYVNEVDRESLLRNETDTRRIIVLLHSDVRAKEWRSGRPPIRAFVDLQETAFLPILLRSSAQYVVTPDFVLHDFLNAFFDFELMFPDATGDAAHSPVVNVSTQDNNRADILNQERLATPELGDIVMEEAISAIPAAIVPSFAPASQPLVPVSMVKPRQPFSQPTQTFTQNPDNAPPSQAFPPRTPAPVPIMQDSPLLPQASTNVVHPRATPLTQSIPAERPRRVIPPPGQISNWRYEQPQLAEDLQPRRQIHPPDERLPHQQYAASRLPDPFSQTGLEIEPRNMDPGFDTDSDDSEL